MAKRENFDISEEEMELIKLRRIRAEEARKRNCEPPRKKKISNREFDERSHRSRSGDEEKSRRPRRDDEERSRRPRRDDEERSRRPRRDDEERSRRPRRDEEERSRRPRRESNLSEEEELRRIRQEEKRKRKAMEENSMRSRRGEDDSIYRDFEDDIRYRRKKKSDDWKDIVAEEEEFDKRKKQNKNGKNPKKKWSKKKKVLVGILIGLGAAVLVFFVLYNFVPGFKTDLAQFVASTDAGKSLIKNKIKDKYEANVWDKDFDSSKVEINAGVDIPEKYKNIALFGLDAREVDVNAANHADTMMIMSVNMDNFETRMASIYRDTYLKMTTEDGSVFYDKANSAYFRGGPLLNVNMLNTCFDLNVTDYVVVNFAGISKIVDAVGGLDVVIDDDEVDKTNFYLMEARYLNGYDSNDKSVLPDLSYAPDGSGVQTLHLSGDYVTAYCRNRYTVFTDKYTGEQVNNDMARTARQRYVLALLISKIKEGGVSGILDASDAILSANTADEQFIRSSMDVDEVVDVLAAALEMSFSNSLGVPDEYGHMEGSYDLVPKDLVYNTQILHKYLFDQENYVCTDDLEKISNEISSRTGVYR